MDTSIYRLRLKDGVVYVVARSREEASKNYSAEEVSEASPEDMFRSAGISSIHQRFVLEFGVMYKQ